MSLDNDTNYLCFENGKKRCEAIRENGKIRIYREWYETGQLKEEFVNGLYTFWNESGQKVREMTFVDGKREKNGPYREWHANGQLAREANIVNDEPDGLDRGWYPNGKKEYEVLYKDGVRVSDLWWDENGTQIYPK